MSSAHPAGTSLPEAERPLAIVAGGGAIPLAVADAAMRRGRSVVMFAVRGWADPGKIERFPHRWVNLGKIGEIQRLLQAEGCRDLVFIGRVLRPAIRQVWPDLAGIRLHQSDQILEQNAFTAAAPADDGQGFAMPDFQIHSAKNFLLPDCFC